jgi:hypothetical protein
LIDVPSRLSAEEVRRNLEVVLPLSSATLLLFAAEPGMTSAKYENAMSLVWRDAGVLQGHLAMAAEAIGLNFCLLGVIGEPWIGALTDEPGLVGVGAAYVGEAK